MRPRDAMLAALSSVIWGVAFVAVAFGLASFSPPRLTALRFLVGAVAVFFVPRPRLPWALLVLIGLTLFTGQFLLLFFAYEAGLPPGLASVTQQTRRSSRCCLPRRFSMNCRRHGSGRGWPSPSPD